TKSHSYCASQTPIRSFAPFKSGKEPRRANGGLGIMIPNVKPFPGGLRYVAMDRRSFVGKVNSLKCVHGEEALAKMRQEMTSPIKYPAEKSDGVLLRLREDYEQAVLDLFEGDVETKEVRPNLKAVGHTSNFLNNMRLPVHRWFR